MTKKKVILSICALVLVCVISISGTLAYLKVTTQAPVVNTFVAAGGGSLLEATGSFVLDESKANKVGNVYELDTTDRVTGNSYEVLPGTTVKKDPQIRVTGKNDVAAYLYVEIVDNTGANLTWSIADGWTRLDSVTGKNGGAVYAYNTTLANPEGTEGGATYTMKVLKDDKVTIGNVEELGLGDGKTMTFYAYLAQAVIDGAVADAKTVYNTAF